MKQTIEQWIRENNLNGPPLSEWNSDGAVQLWWTNNGGLQYQSQTIELVVEEEKAAMLQTLALKASVAKKYSR